MSCEKGCFETVISCCDNIVIKAAFPPNYGMYWVINKVDSNNIYQKLTQTNNQGDLLINKADLPNGYLTKGSNIQIKVKDGANYLQPITFIYGGINYGCTLANLSTFIKDITDNSGVNIIQFTESIVPNNGNNNNNSNPAITIPFINETALSYTHNLGRLVDVSIYQLDGTLISANVDTSNPNTLFITFNQAYSGRVLIQ